MASQLITFFRTLRSCFKLLLCLLCFLLYFIISLMAVFVLSFIKPARRRRLNSRLIRLFDLCLVRIINIKVNVSNTHGPFSRNGLGVFLVSNHLSYVDGFVLGSAFPLIYMGKAEIRQWPLIGPMTELSGTLFIDKQKKNHIAEYIADVASVLKGGANVLFFPEGTSTNGETLLPFKSAFFEAPLMACAPIVPVAVIYKSVNGRPVTKENRDSVYWYGDMTFADHFFKLLFCDRVEAEIKVHSPLAKGDEGDKILARKHASELAYEAIRKDINLIGPASLT